MLEKNEAAFLLAGRMGLAPETRGPGKRCSKTDTIKPAFTAAPDIYAPVRKDAIWAGRGRNLLPLDDWPSHFDHRAAGSENDQKPIFPAPRSEEHTSELQSLMRHSYAVFCLKKQINNNILYM